MAPRVGLVLGDPGGIGPELVAKLLATPEIRRRAEILVIGDPWLFAEGQRVAGLAVPVRAVDRPEDARFDGDRPVLLRHDTVAPDEVQPGQASAAGGRSVLRSLERALALAKAGMISAVCFAPLNKHAMHLAGSGFPDELHWFAHQLGHTGPCCELNVLGALWTSRVTSHVALKEVAAGVTRDRVVEAVRLAAGALRRAGVGNPRIAVAALNPHAGDGGIFGREEIELIGPAVADVRGEGVTADGPFPADTIFLKARDGEYDAVVTMYHDQGQVAMKLMGFDRGVTVQGGLPVPITTPAHGTAYDIVGQGRANVEATRQAFLLACRMGEAGPRD